MGHIEDSDITTFYCYLFRYFSFFDVHWFLLIKFSGLYVDSDKQLLERFLSSYPFPHSPDLFS